MQSRQERVMIMNKIVEAMVEITTGSQNKYEYDKDRKMLKLDRVLYSSVHYPTEYGYIPDTLAPDGDPLDILIYTTSPTFPGCLIDSRVIGVLIMTDDKGLDEKVLAVPADDPRFTEINSLEDMPQHILKEIEHFFQVYKHLENKQVIIEGWKDTKTALTIIEESYLRYNH